MASPFPSSLAKPQRKRRPFKRLHSATKARADIIYSLAEIVRLYDVDEQTVRNWCKAGLKRVETKSRFLVRGDELNAFHAARNAHARQHLALTEFLCLRCHAPREPAAGSIVGIHDDKPGLGLKARCQNCNTAMYRPWSKAASLALLARPDLWPPSPSTANVQPSTKLDHPAEMQRIATACDSVIPAKTSAHQKPTRTPRKPAKTHESSQFALPFEV